MSTVKIEPFSFETEENGVQLKPEQLPGAIEISSEDNKEEKPVVTKQDPKRSENVAIDTEEEETSMICMSVMPKLTWIGSDSLATGRSSVLYLSSR